MPLNWAYIEPKPMLPIFSRNVVMAKDYDYFELGQFELTALNLTLFAVEVELGAGIHDV